LFASRLPRRPSASPSNPRLGVEALEDRCLLSVSAVNDMYSVHQGQVLNVASPSQGVLANDTGVGPLSVVGHTDPQHGSLDLNADGTFTFSADAGFVGTDGFTYTAADGTDQAVGTVTISLNGVVLTVPGDQTDYIHDAVSIQASAGDGTGGTITYAAAGLPGSLAINPATGVISGTLGAGGAYQVTVSATDGTYSDSQTFTWTVLSPVSVTYPGSLSNREGEVVSLPIEADDTNQETLTYAAAGLPNGLSIDPSTGIISGTVSTGAAAHGPFMVTVTADDGGYSGLTTFEWDIATINQPAVAFDDSYTAPHDQPLTIAAGDGGVLDNDMYVAGAQAVLVSGVAHGQVTLNSDGSFTYTPDAGYLGSDVFSYQAQYGATLSNTAQVTLTVIDDNAPTAPDTSFDVHAGQSLIDDAGLSQVASDADDEPLHFEVVAAPQHGTLTLNYDGTFQYDAAAGYVGTDTFSYKTNDGALDSPTDGTVTINVTDTAPVAGDAAFDLADGGELSASSSRSLLANCFDMDGDPLTVQLVAGPSHAASFTLNANGTFSYVAAAGFDGQDSFTVQASDGILLSNTATVQLTASSTPIGVTDVYSVSAGVPFITFPNTGVLSNDFSPGGDLYAVLVTAPSTGTFNFNADGSFAYYPDASTPTDAQVTFQYRPVVSGTTNIGNVTTVILVPPGALPTFSATTVKFANALPVLEDGTDTAFFPG
jgi:VCBS repeat-containing protein